MTNHHLKLIKCSFLFFCRKLAVYDDWSSVVIHVAMDNTVIQDDISKCNTLHTY